MIGGWLFSLFGMQGVTGLNVYSLSVAVIGVTDEKTFLLYAVSTLPQTCAALRRSWALRRGAAIDEGTPDGIGSPARHMHGSLLPSRY